MRRMNLQTRDADIKRENAKKHRISRVFINALGHQIFRPFADSHVKAIGGISFAYAFHLDV